MHVDKHSEHPEVENRERGEDQKAGGRGCPGNAHMLLLQPELETSKNSSNGGARGGIRLVFSPPFLASSVRGQPPSRSQGDRIPQDGRGRASSLLSFALMTPRQVAGEISSPCGRAERASERIIAAVEAGETCRLVKSAFLFASFRGESSEPPARPPGAGSHTLNPEREIKKEKKERNSPGFLSCQTL